MELTVHRKLTIGGVFCWPETKLTKLTKLIKLTKLSWDQAELRPSISTFKQLAQESSINQLIIGTQLWILTMSMKMMMMNRKMMKVMTKGWCGAVCSSDHAIIRRQPGQEGVRWQRSLPCHPPPLPSHPLPSHPQKSEPPPPLARTRSHQQEPQFWLIRLRLDTWDELPEVRNGEESSVFFVNYWFSVFL